MPEQYPISNINYLPPSEPKSRLEKIVDQVEERLLRKPLLRRLSQELDQQAMLVELLSGPDGQRILRTLDDWEHWRESIERRMREYLIQVSELSMQLERAQTEIRNLRSDLDQPDYPYDLGS